MANFKHLLVPVPLSLKWSMENRQTFIKFTFQDFLKGHSGFWKEVKLSFNISNLGLSFDWRKQDWNASNFPQSFKIFSSSLGKSWDSAVPVAIEDESLWRKAQKARNDKNFGLTNLRVLNKKMLLFAERAFHMEANCLNIPRCKDEWRKITQKPSGDYCDQRWRPLTWKR